MTSTSFRPGRRAVVAAAAALPLGAALAACSSDTGDGPALGEDDAAEGSPFADAIESGPVAEDDAISASAWATAIKDKGSLIRGGTVANQVFSLASTSGGQPTGFDAGITQLLAKYILGEGGDEKVEYVDTTVETREKLVENGTVDCVIATYSVTPERLEVINFAGPYYLSGTAIQVRTEDKDTVSGPEDLSGLNLVTQSNSTGVQAIEEFVTDPGDVQTLPDNESCVAALKQERSDAYVLDQGVLLGNSAADPDVTVVGEPFVDDPYGIGLSQDDEDAVDFVNTFLQAIIDSGTWESLWTATVGEVIDGDAPEPPVPGDLPS
ncbi:MULTISPECIES: glutamate ABC transporter substrate-binding protein [Brachybacterium]|uniref:glutamate ABC transporter substrate-binding protein n=1 Tax=Brachybacterium TaxID=43668 RepID=UPI000BB886A4|nr:MULTISPECIES: glutamate ABC transporter substrate-binding protein [Brachybacterium]PCC33595.1 amino acid-binding protein [Brachybacterium alimentarium]RCS66356.1 glutamate ABC transporter substrate-binding protein [Brachybacterium sp. JB7]RCS75283.1 glutamate ABC transporter substrate-binding protein [Brachybacterium alimentarium]RCS79362.1 glutamate ABC transporter substrate-binding protein [Brachybacterium alimentarium]RCS88193.1 glutamate ABC transporter substrate-binding protein [Brachy